MPGAGRVTSIHGMADRKSMPTLSDEQLGELLGLMEGADSVELKLTVPESDRFATIHQRARRAKRRSPFSELGSRTELRCERSERAWRVAVWPQGAHPT